jgi:Domain of unknown function (DUF397)
MEDALELRWHKSSYSSSSGGGNCVEVCTAETFVAVRDSKDATGPALTFTHQAWDTFVTGIRHGEFSL